MQTAKELYMCLAVFALVSTIPVYAAPGDTPPTAFLERATIVGVGKNVHVTRVPVQDINSAVRYLDLEISLNVNGAGMVDAATVISVPSPQFLTQELIAGNYQDADGNQCTLTTGVAHEGRNVVAINCIESGSSLSTSLYTGPIAGHLLEQELIAAGIDQIPGHGNLTWGKVINQTSFSAIFNCYRTGHIIGANQVGNVLTITNYQNDNLVDCGQNFTFVEP